MANTSVKKRNLNKKLTEQGDKPSEAKLTNGKSVDGASAKSKSKQPAKENKNANKKATKQQTSAKTTKKSAKGVKASPFTRLLKLLFWLFLILHVIGPIILHYSPYLQRHLIFLNFVKWPPNLNLTKPEALGLHSVRNFYITQEKENITLGIWHSLPQGLVDQAIKERHSIKFYEESLKSGKPIILYMHGNSGTRGSGHRIKLYHVLKALDVHVLTFDYRGYADSSDVVPTEKGVVEDAKFMYRWVKSRAGKSPVFIWGHSLGTGVSTKAVKELKESKEFPHGLILESPFDNLSDEMKYHPIAITHKLWSDFLEWALGLADIKFDFFDWMIVQPTKDIGLTFTSDKSISDVHIPILMMHAVDDLVIPISLADNLYESALQTRPKDVPAVKYIRFEDHHDYGHRYICLSPELPKIVGDFLESGIKYFNSKQ